jgi:hypothetical protein
MSRTLIGELKFNRSKMTSDRVPVRMPVDDKARLRRASL